VWKKDETGRVTPFTKMKKKKVGSKRKTKKKREGGGERKS